MEHQKTDEAKQETHEFTSDSGYFGWVQSHPYGFVLSVRGKKPLLHRASCIHIDRHNNPGALTERGSRKICAEAKEALYRWSKTNGVGNGITLEKCKRCL